MATVRPFQCVRPNKEVVSRVAALPYDVYNREEAKEVVKKEPLSFLNIDRAETQFDDSVDTYAPCVYEKASEMLHAWIDNGTFIKDETNCYYVYELIMNGRSQTGIVACSSIDDYQNNIIKKYQTCGYLQCPDRTYLSCISIQERNQYYRRCGYENRTIICVYLRRWSHT